MGYIYDLHCHSIFSDGSLSPTDVVGRAAANGVDVLALTDHDSTKGIVEARQAARQCGIELIAGVEVSVTWSNQTIHIVGLGIDIENEKLQQGLALIRQQRAFRTKRMAEKLEKLGMTDVLNKIIAYAGCESATRTHFARYLVDQGIVKDMQGAFKKYLGRKGKAFVGGDWVSLEEAVTWICDAGGQAIIAHPVRYNMTNTKLGALIDEFKSFGGTAIEVSTSTHMPHERKKIAKIAEQYGLLSSVGSDFHSPGNPRVELGHNLRLPENAIPIWHDWNIEANSETVSVVNGGVR